LRRAIPQLLPPEGEEKKKKAIPPGRRKLRGITCHSKALGPSTTVGYEVAIHKDKSLRALRKRNAGIESYAKGRHLLGGRRSKLLERQAKEASYLRK